MVIMVDDNNINQTCYTRLADLKDEISLNNIPTLSPASMKLMKLIFDKDIDIDDLVKTIQKDINLSLEVVRIANSPRYRTSLPIDSVPKAIVYLGLDVIKNIVLSISVKGTMKSLLSIDCYNLVLSHSVATAAAAQILAQHVDGLNADQAFLTGLFLDLGLFVCASLYPNDFVGFVKESMEKGIHLKVVIKEKIGIDANKLSFQIAEKWKLPPHIFNNIDCKSQILLKDQDPSIELEPLVIVSFLSMLAADVYFGSSTIVNIALFKHYFFTLLGKNNAVASEVLNMLSDEFNDTSDTLGLNLPILNGYIDILKKSNGELLSINLAHEAMYKELYKSNAEILKQQLELDKKNKMLSKLVTFDPLTSLYNRRYFVKSLERLVAETKRYKNPLSLLMIGIDGFRDINEQYGLNVGDEILVQVARHIKQTFRDSDICTRYSSREFMVILPQTPGANAVFAAEKIRVAIEESKFKENSSTSEISITSSLGLATYSDKIDSVVKMIQECTIQLKNAKEAGRNCIRYQPK